MADIKLNFNSAVIVLLVLQVFLSFNILGTLNDLGAQNEDEQDDVARDLVAPCHYYNSCCYYAYAYDEAQPNSDEEHREEEEEREHQ